MKIKVGYEVKYKPENLYYRVTALSMTFGKQYAHLTSIDGTGKVMRVALPFPESYFAMPDDPADMLAEF
jgi:hypothetical protein